MVRTVTKKANGNIKRNVAVLGVEVEVGHQEDEANHQEGEAGHREDEKVVAALLVEEGLEGTHSSFSSDLQFLKIK
jgi:hypothetical protein